MLILLSVQRLYPPLGSHVFIHVLVYTPVAIAVWHKIGGANVWNLVTHWDPRARMYFRGASLLLYSVWQCSACAFKHSVSQLFSSDYVKERIIFYHRSKKNCEQIVHYLVKEGHTASKVGVMKFLQRYRETGTIARAPRTGQASKLTLEIRRVFEEKMEKNDETTGLELQKLLLKEVVGFDASLSSILRWRNDLAKGTKNCQMIRDVNKE